MDNKKAGGSRTKFNFEHQSNGSGNGGMVLLIIALALVALIFLLAVTHPETAQEIINAVNSFKH